MNILNRILITKTEEVEAGRSVRPLARVKADAAAAPAPRGFIKALATPPGIQCIAEVKKASPSKGIIRQDFNAVAIARAYETAGAACLSVLTDVQYFQGSLRDLIAVREAVSLPLLRKDFIIDPYQVYEARAAGADAILLIVGAFHGVSAGGRTPADMQELANLAEELGMDVLTEVHTAAELDVALEYGGKLLGLNNRDLQTFHTSLDVTFSLAPKVPKDRVIVSESGITSHSDIKELEARAGAKAVLVGESLMSQPDVAEGLRKLLHG